MLVVTLVCLLVLAVMAAVGLWIERHHFYGGVERVVDDLYRSIDALEAHVKSIDLDPWPRHHAVSTREPEEGPDA
jgi:hypothetical protein